MVIIMKILITGGPGTGKTLYSVFLADNLHNLPIIESDNFTDFSSFTNKVKELSNCIAVVQDSKFFTEQLKFDQHFRCSRNMDNLEKFFVSSPTGVEEHLFSDMGEYY